MTPPEKQKYNKNELFKAQIKWKNELRNELLKYISSVIMPKKKTTTKKEKCTNQMFKAQKDILETACSRKTFYRPPPSISSLRLLRIENSDLRFRSLLPVSK